MEKQAERRNFLNAPGAESESFLKKREDFAVNLRKKKRQDIIQTKRRLPTLPQEVKNEATLGGFNDFVKFS